MKTSESIKEIASALAKAQGSMNHPKFNQVNPFFKSKYADLTAVINCIRQPFADNGLSFTQHTECINGKNVVTTLVMHVSGEWMKSSMPLITTATDMQKLASSITYAKRYSLSAICGLSSEEDTDGNEPSKESPKETKLVYTQVRTGDGKPFQSLNDIDLEVDKLVIDLGAVSTATDFIELKRIAGELKNKCSLSKEQMKRLTNAFNDAKDRTEVTI
jgi:hypothetical protein